MGPGGMHPRVLRELEGTIATLLTIILEGLWRLGKVSEHCKKPVSCPVFRKGKEDPWSPWPVRLTSVPGKVMEHLIVEAITVHMDDKNVIRSRQHGFT